MSSAQASKASFRYIDGYTFASGIVFVFILAKLFVPGLIHNESVYLIPSRQIIDPSFLANDWGLGPGVGEGMLSIVFSFVIAPIWYFLNDPVLVALASRLLLWGFLIYALAGLAKELNIRWYYFTIGLVIWIYSGQSLVAGEWIFGGAEQKCLAYGFLILSLRSVLRDRIVTAGILCGIALLCHVLIGFWGAIAISGGILICIRNYNLRKLLAFSLGATVVGLPVFLIALQYLISPPGAGEVSTAQKSFINILLVIFRSPHHNDPYFFFIQPDQVLQYTILKMCIFALAMIYATRILLPKKQAEFISAFFGCLALFFIAGLVARYLEMFWFLKYYPFRLLDSLLPLFFWMMVPSLIVQRGVIISLKHRSLDKLSKFGIFIVMTSLVVAVWEARNTPALVLHQVPYMQKLWSDYLIASDNTVDNVAKWIRKHTPKDATIAIHPCMVAFSLKAERAIVVTYKSAPSNARILEWYSRLNLLNNNKKLRSPSFGACAELNQNYPILQLQYLQTARKNYSADYYLNTKRRADLTPLLVYQNSPFFLYDLSILDKNPNIKPRRAGSLQLFSDPVIFR